jgi:hypothetical protein
VPPSWKRNFAWREPRRAARAKPPLLCTDYPLGGLSARIDTDRESASTYADLFIFDVIELDSYHPHRHIEAIQEAEAGGYRVLIIDSPFATVRLRTTVVKRFKKVEKEEDLKRLIAEEELNAKVARMIYEARTRTGFTQQQLAKRVKRVGTTQPMIARLEDADYRGHSLTMLQRIAKALNGQLEIHLVSGKRRLKAA